MADQWYLTADMPPPIKVQVRVEWNGRVFPAARIRERKTHAVLWATITRGEVVWLPPPHEAETWGAEPRLWQPLDAATWKERLPRPVVGPRGGLVIDAPPNPVAGLPHG